MVYIYFTVFEVELSPKVYNELLSQLPLTIQEEVKKFQKWKDAQASLYGKLLLKKAIQDLHIPATLESIKFGEKDRPFWEDPVWDFNISHSGKYVLCALAENARVGVDIEKHRKVDITLFDRYFTKNEWEEINNAKTPLDKFFHFWSLKESAIKADGLGTLVLSATEKINETQVICNGNVWEYKALFFEEGYSSFVCTDKPFTADEIIISSPLVF